MNENPTLEQRVNQFDIRHGNNAVRIGRMLVFEDGASRDVAMSGMMTEPPNDPRERVKMQIAYRQEKVRLAVRDFEDLRGDLLGKAQANLKEGLQTQPPPCSEAEAIERLEKLRDVVTLRRAELEQLKQQLQTATPDWLQNQRLIAAENQEKNSKFIHVLSTIRV
jgi:hypothetical protein